ncbi:hypothetical protein C1Y40_02282 [Mycobacterium talmoniae]|uniref:Uncharacterized protein n=1 Tax=Mycobacterium talmoniae TaxID=1858794 RepID=A0A2S8BLG1_9MYCO|nr:hypothetical protein C1Y40_02282 [Mycobacterium talmoniae]
MAHWYGSNGPDRLRSRSAGTSTVVTVASGAPWRSEVR